MLLHTDQSLEAQFEIDVRPLYEVTGVDRERRTVQFRQAQTGEMGELPYDREPQTDFRSRIGPD
ncbi:hypothetical protein [Deinococcus radiophilus]|uniref:hypothetical protein n=1 Tax=Deinococcus radiophilus TaxID=32062 RepID=UPI00147287E4|nr:hypothetical protein [Deinococcus radiophilus]